MAHECRTKDNIGPERPVQPFCSHEAVISWWLAFEL